MAHIFISYAREDRGRASLLAGALKEHGWSVWWDRDLSVGADFSQLIEQELNEALCVIVLWSGRSVNSTWVRNEASAALKRGVLRPLLIEAVPDPLEFRHLHKLSLVDWHGSPAHEEFGSLVRDLEQLLPPTIVQLKEPLLHRLENGPARQIGLIAGRLKDLPVSIDVWVVPENIDMQLPRFHDQSMSAHVRYLGARCDERGDVIKDIIADDLAMALGTSSKRVAPGSVIATGPGQLDRFGVRQIYHLAAVYGQHGSGYQPVPDLASCITAALERTACDDQRSFGLRSILFPILGSQTGSDVRTVVASQIRACIDYFKKNSTSPLSAVYFLLQSDRQLNACLSVLDEASLPPATGGQPRLS